MGKINPYEDVYFQLRENVIGFSRTRRSRSFSSTRKVFPDTIPPEAFVIGPGVRINIFVAAESNSFMAASPNKAVSISRYSAIVTGYGSRAGGANASKTYGSRPGNNAGRASAFFLESENENVVSSPIRSNFKRSRPASSGSAAASSRFRRENVPRKELGEGPSVTRGSIPLDATSFRMAGISKKGTSACESPPTARNDCRRAAAAPGMSARTDRSPDLSGLTVRSIDAAQEPRKIVATTPNTRTIRFINPLSFTLIHLKTSSAGEIRTASRRYPHPMYLYHGSLSVSRSAPRRSPIVPRPITNKLPHLLGFRDNDNRFVQSTEGIINSFQVHSTCIFGNPLPYSYIGCAWRGNLT